MATSSVSAVLDGIASSSTAFNNNEAGSREALIEHSRALAAVLEIPSEFIQRTFWAEPAQSAIIRLAVDVEIFQLLQEAGNAGLTPDALAQKAGVDVILLSRLARHLVAMNLFAFHDGAFHGTRLSNDLAVENFQHTISFCYDASRPSFNTFPKYFEKTKYKSPTLGGTDAGKADWHEFYPVTERMLASFDSSLSDVLLVDVGGGRGHDVATFAAHYTSRPGRIILQDREPVIAGVVANGAELPFEAQTHNSFTPQPIKGARTYFLHSILHDWSDDDGDKILENLVPALGKGYSRENPTLAATNMDMMMLAHFAVRERMEAAWRNILVKA
ncbi:hypothetical protein BDV40DRAFT_310786 [Aspergillus tamarii]|uniref:Uncharacterized protein n=1 Tax=Aspergillus tamarii TaxID=41984 RepID=A0A5N6V0W0_ASPTM|nr:hypothetical protein BDV40DRAFT_310786 [Aspergillus tamarii]